MNDFFYLSLIPAIATILGSAVSLIRVPSPMMRSLLQHLAAGIVFSVVAVELLPNVIQRHRPLFVVLGFCLGVAAMLALKGVTGSTVATRKTSVSATLLIAIAVDILLDGFLIGMARAAGQNAGTLLGLALTVELFSLGLAIAIELREGGYSVRKVLGTVCGITLLLPLGAATGTLILSRASDAVVETVLSLGLVALLFLVTEELLTEAHEIPETPVATASFFLGFLVFLILGMLN